MAVYPVGGWWKENPAHHRYNCKVRYSLIVSIRALSSSIDIYTPVQIQIDTPISSSLQAPPGGILLIRRGATITGSEAFQSRSCKRGKLARGC